MPEMSEVIEDRLLQNFKDLFGEGEGIKGARAPGRLNFIGEHTDYQEGFVLPGAIDRYIYVLGRKIPQPQLILYSGNYSEEFRCSPEEIEKFKGKNWYGYVLGVINLLKERIDLQGLQLYIWGNIPIGKGLSTSAALEVSTLLALMQIYDVSLPDKEIVKLARKAENEFVGVPCGIMDQFASLFSQKGNLLFLDTRNLKYKHIPLNMEEVSLLILDSNVRRTLGETPYQQRKEECEEAVKILRNYFPHLKTLRDLIDVESGWEDKLPPLLRKRALHVVSENKRVLEVCSLLRQGDFKKAGELLFHSHLSLKDNFEVSCEELDILVDLSLQSGKVYGARMMGAGFGGCTINLVEKGKEEEVVEFIKEKYTSLTQKEITPFLFHLQKGAKPLSLS